MGLGSGGWEDLAAMSIDSESQTNGLVDGAMPSNLAGYVDQHQIRMQLARDCDGCADLPRLYQVLADREEKRGSAARGVVCF